ncbi:hypothetical protein KY46_07880 [Photobacterium halotolerans]|uniref:Uncharacterized protein n=1 Tax=Photobacterium halotolerans TaxID=265726 RepID=A0A0F5VFE3_9GAMM|nr:hypothetical protein KY46_07880 [Photobacterium halotolerans]
MAHDSASIFTGSNGERYSENRRCQSSILSCLRLHLTNSPLVTKRNFFALTLSESSDKDMPDLDA